MWIIFLIAQKIIHYGGNLWNLNIDVDIVVLDKQDVGHISCLGGVFWLLYVSVHVLVVDKRNPKMDLYGTNIQ